jgi:hypothetical protein
MNSSLLWELIESLFLSEHGDMAAHIHQALEQVREIRKRVVDRQLFSGYSGNARIAGGGLSFLGALVLSSELVEQTNGAHFIGWGVVCGVAFFINLFALLRWHMREAGEKRLTRLRPVLDILGPFVVGAVLTAVFASEGLYDHLFGMWMLVFGLMNIASRHALPRSVWNLGWYYVACGVFYLLVWDERSFLDPWPMGVVFFIGEIAGGVIFVENRKSLLSGGEK